MRGDDQRDLHQLNRITTREPQVIAANALP
jgi:hypothetical protein